MTKGTKKNLTWLLGLVDKHFPKYSVCLVQRLLHADPSITPVLYLSHWEEKGKKGLWIDFCQGIILLFILNFFRLKYRSEPENCCSTETDGREITQIYIELNSFSIWTTFSFQALQRLFKSLFLLFLVQSDPFLILFMSITDKVLILTNLSLCPFWTLKLSSNFLHESPLYHSFWGVLVLYGFRSFHFHFNLRISLLNLSSFYTVPAHNSSSLIHFLHVQQSQVIPSRT